MHWTAALNGWLVDCLFFLESSTIRLIARPIGHSVTLHTIGSCTSVSVVKKFVSQIISWGSYGPYHCSWLTLHMASAKNQQLIWLQLVDECVDSSSIMFQCIYIQKVNIISAHLPRILLTHPWDTLNCLLMSHGLTPLCESSTILRLIWSGRGLPLTKRPPSWFTPPCPRLAFIASVSAILYYWSSYTLLNSATDQ